MSWSSAGISAADLAFYLGFNYVCQARLPIVDALFFCRDQCGRFGSLLEMPFSLLGSAPAVQQICLCAKDSIKFVRFGS